MNGDRDAKKTDERKIQAGTGDYLLGVNRTELERLRFQHSVWKGVTDAFFDRIGVSTGWQCLDVGAGPGFVTADLRGHVGDTGGVVAIEPSELYTDFMRDEISRMGWTNVECIRTTAEEAHVAPGRFDLIFARWVLSFVTDPENFFRSLARGLRPGGFIAVQDYYYEGLSLFPIGGPFDRMADVVRAHYRGAGGDPYVAGTLPGIFRKLGLTVVDFKPNCLAGGPGSGIMEWASRFFTVHIDPMVEKGLISRADGDAVLADWRSHSENPEALFFSPLVVDVAARLGSS